MKVRSVFAVIALAVALLFTCPANAGSVTVTNAGFETGDLTGWTTSGNLSSFSVDAFNAQTGNFGLNANQVSTFGFLSQTLTTTPGVLYTVSFWLADNAVLGDVSSTATSTELIAIFDGVTKLDLVDTVPSPNPGVQSFQATASGTSTVLTFGFRNDSASYSFDNVSVTFADTAVPEPATVGLIGLGLCSVAFLRRRKAR